MERRKHWAHVRSFYAHWLQLVSLIFNITLQCLSKLVPPGPQPLQNARQVDNLGLGHGEEGASWDVKQFIYPLIPLNYDHELWVMTERTGLWLQVFSVGCLCHPKLQGEELAVSSSVFLQKFRGFGYLLGMPLLDEKFQACPIRRRPRGGARTSWRNYRS